MTSRPLRVLSNIERLETRVPPGLTLEHRFICTGTDRLAFWRLFVGSFWADVVLVENNPWDLWPLCLLRTLWPFGLARLVSLDIQLVKPNSWNQRLKAWVFRRLLRRVDHFIHYFKDLDGYRRYFGIGGDRSSYLPFKVNGWETMPPLEELSAEGQYVFTGGRSLRDIDAFLAAMKLVPYPAVLLYQDRSILAANGTELALNHLPANVRAVKHDGNPASWARYLREARLVVLTPLPDSIRATGISTYLHAMALKKCVVITAGPATTGILDQEAIVVPPGDPVALAAAIRKAWEDDALREATAAAGRKYAERLGGTDRLFADVLKLCAKLAGRRTSETPPGTAMEMKGA